MFGVGCRLVLRVLVVCSALMALIAAARAPATAQEDNEDSPYRSGLIAIYSAGDRSATRVDETIAFDWQDAACEERLPAGEFTATWRGRLWARGAGSYRLLCYVSGEIELTLVGKTVVSGKTKEPQWLSSQPLDLDFDYHPFEVSFRKIGATAQLALFWTGPDFRLEPIPARALLHDRAQSPSRNFERGHQLASALRCAACHLDSSAPVLPAPALDRLSGNIHYPWLIDWLSQHPQARRASEDSRGAGVPPAIPNRSVSEGSSFRRMPDLGMTRDEAEMIAAWLVCQPSAQPKKSEPKETKAPKSETKKSDAKGGKKGKADEKPKPSAEQGERIMLTRGCLACHKLGELGESGLFGGGDLTAIASKRPADFLTRWLENPSGINRHHRMPAFTFTADELSSLSLWAKEQERVIGTLRVPLPGSPAIVPDTAKVREGEKLTATFRCAACHELFAEPGKRQQPEQKELTASSDWSRSCAGEPDRAKTRPGYCLAKEDQAALKDYYSQPRPSQEKVSPQARGRDLLVQLNCLACHQREGIDRTALIALRSREGSDRTSPGEGPQNSFVALQDKLTAVAESRSELAPLVPAMTPPALNSVGDKLQDSALADAISRQGPPHRPYLLVQMPKFNLTKDQLTSLVAYFTATDRVPESSPVGPRLDSSGKTAAMPVRAPGESRTDSPTLAALTAAGPRLVTTDGLACTSCHQVGSVEPSKAPLNARGPDMTMLGKRIRREWFDRWCDNPARIVPRMEMPAVKIPVRGVLNDKIDDQLAAVWHILNTPGFEPPEPNPVRVLRLSGLPERNERTIVIHDVVKDGDKTYLFPLVIGLPNRHNILFDLETNRLAAWWLGDTARQRTKGKSWWWEMGGKSLRDSSPDSDISIVFEGREYVPTREGQFTATLDSARAESYPQQPSAAVFTYHLMLGELSGRTNNRLSVEEKCQVPNPLRPIRDPGSGSFARDVTIRGAPMKSQLRFRIVSEDEARKGSWDSANRVFYERDARYWARVESPAQLRWNGDGTFTWPDDPAGAPRRTNTFTLTVTYGSRLQADQYVASTQPLAPSAIKEIQIAPGFSGQCLPLPGDIMPSGLAWLNDRLIYSTLKGQVCAAKDSNGDGLEDDQATLVDGLATPYGLCPNVEGDLMVATKTGLLHCEDSSSGDNVNDHRAGFTILASGWGYTDDYHDWAVGPVAGDNGEFFIALPCQQDQRTDPAASLRGRLIKLTPKRNPGDPRRFDIKVLSSGHRFPMGMARNRDGELFVTDNQGNYNPFNELNHVRKGAHFGFINALEKQTGFRPPPLEEPAINIPHPWTRSVNGICFLDTPVGWDQRAQLAPAHQSSAPSNGGPAPAAGLSHPTKSIYGALEGHLVGCEYDTRRLIRMSLQKIGDTYQGCAYPLSIPPADVEKGLLGPIVCAIKPTTGELYVGEIRDSGWGAGNNIGQIVKIKIEPEKLACGIAEVRATKTGFTIDFFQPVDRAKAADLASYSISSYRRESTPAYGGPDLDRRDEKIASAELSPDAKRVMLTLPELRTGHVYEIRLKNLTPGGGLFHPDEAHYTLRQIP